MPTVQIHILHFTTGICYPYYTTRTRTVMIQLEFLALLSSFNLLYSRISTPGKGLQIRCPPGPLILTNTLHLTSKSI